MRNLFLASACLLILTVSCKKEGNFETTPPSGQEIQPKHPVCGMYEGMARMSPEMRKMIKENALKRAVQSPELLLYLDFDGAVIRPGYSSAAVSGTGSSSTYSSPLVISTSFAYPCPLSAAQNIGIAALVADDFSAFNIRVTTNLTEYVNYSPSSQKHISVITTTPSVLGFYGGGMGGISPWSGPGLRQPCTVSFTFASVYNGDTAGIAHTISHEVAHTLGLDHQPEISPQPDDSCHIAYEYNQGFGSGLLGFAPIMGDGLQRVSNWFAQGCPPDPVGGSYLPQDDYELIESQVQVKTDDFPNTLALAPTVSTREISGILEGNDANGNPDVDFLKINIKGRRTINISSENADIKATLYGPLGTVIGTYDDPADLRVSIPATSGIRYLKIEAVSNANMEARFMTGMYKISY